MKVIQLLVGLVVSQLSSIQVCQKRDRGSACNHERRRAEPARRFCPPPLMKKRLLAWSPSDLPCLIMSKSQRRLKIEDREAISRGLAQGQSGAEIASEILRDASVVNREIARNGGRRAYRASKANESARSARGQKRRNKINDSSSLLAEICTLLLTGAAPKQIELALRRKHPHDLSQRVSHETIYDFIYCYAKGQLRKDLISHLRRKKPRRSPSPKARTKLSGQLPGAVNIAERPAEVALREIPGHWEADLVMGAGNRTAILVMCERVTRFVMIVPLVSKDAPSVCRALVRSFKQFPAHLRKTLTYDNGREMAHHLAFAMATDMKVYFWLSRFFSGIDAN